MLFNLFKKFKKWIVSKTAQPIQALNYQKAFQNQRKKTTEVGKHFLVEVN